MLNNEVVMINIHIKTRNIKPGVVNVYYHSPKREFRTMTWDKFLNTEHVLRNAYHVRVWDGENAIEFGKANNVWFVIKPKFFEMGFAEKISWLVNLERSCMTPDWYKNDIRKLIKETIMRGSFLVPAIFGNGWDTDKWVNPHLPVIYKGKQIPMPDDVARDLAIAYIITNE